MKQTILINSQSVQQGQLLAALSRVFAKAQTFYLHKAEAAGPGNLRRQFVALADLHQQIVDLLPAPNGSDPAEIAALSELSRWYNHRPETTSVQHIQQGLSKQLQLQKTLIKSSDLHQHRITLLHFTASLQIAADQLAQSH